MIRPGLLPGPRLRQQGLPAELHALQRRGGRGRHRRLRPRRRGGRGLLGRRTGSGTPPPSEARGCVPRRPPLALGRRRRSPARRRRGPDTPARRRARCSPSSSPTACPSPSRPSSTGCARSPAPRTSQTALIPLGRSLQRYAAAPDYFASPRLVVAVTGDRAAGPGDPAPRRPALPRLPARRRGDRGDQLQRRRRPLRVPGDRRLRRRPAAALEPAERRVCLACHQGQGPIFARPLWSETNANPAIAARLAPLGAELPRRAGRARPSTGSRPSTPPPTAPPASPLADRLWAEGCPDAACRAALLAAALRVGLGGAPPRRPRRAGLRARAAALWPDGLAAASPDLPNRDPLPTGRRPATSRPTARSTRRPRARPVVALAPRPGRLRRRRPRDRRRSSPPATSPGSTPSCGRAPAPPRPSPSPAPPPTAALPAGGSETRFACAGAGRPPRRLPRRRRHAAASTLLALPGQPPARRHRPRRVAAPRRPTAAASRAHARRRHRATLAPDRRPRRRSSAALAARPARRRSGRGPFPRDGRAGADRRAASEETDG